MRIRIEKKESFKYIDNRYCHELVYVPEYNVLYAAMRSGQCSVIRINADDLSEYSEITLFGVTSGIDNAVYANGYVWIGMGISKQLYLVRIDPSFEHPVQGNGWEVFIASDPFFSTNPVNKIVFENGFLWIAGASPFMAKKTGIHCAKISGSYIHNPEISAFPINECYHLHGGCSGDGFVYFTSFNNKAIGKNDKLIKIDTNNPSNVVSFDIDVDDMANGVGGDDPAYYNDLVFVPREIAHPPRIFVINTVNGDYFYKDFNFPDVNHESHYTEKTNGIFVIEDKIWVLFPGFHRQEKEGEIVWIPSKIKIFEPEDLKEIYSFTIPWEQKQITDITIDNGGTGYSAGSITFSGGGGNGAEAVYYVDGNGIITSIRITENGDNYTKAPIVQPEDEGDGNAILQIYGYGIPEEIAYGNNNEIFLVCKGEGKALMKMLKCTYNFYNEKSMIDGFDHKMINGGLIR